MDFLTDWLTNWLKELLISGIMGNLEGLFDTVNAKVGEIAVQVGTTPAAWNAGVFSLIRQLSETVILPIAGLVLTFVATYELIQMLLEKNNMHEFDVANIYKWVFKTACAILILSNTFNIVMAVFDVSQSVIADAAGLIQGSTDITPDMLAELETTLEGMDLGPLLGLWLQSSVIGLTIRNMGAYMRKMALNGYVLHVDLSPVRELVSLQRRCSNNLNQVAIQANTYGGIYPEEIAALQRDYAALWGPLSDLLKKLSALVEL